MYKNQIMKVFTRKILNGIAFSSEQTEKSASWITLLVLKQIENCLNYKPLNDYQFNWNTVGKVLCSSFHEIVTHTGASLASESYIER